MKGNKTNPAATELLHDGTVEKICELQVEKSDYYRLIYSGKNSEKQYVKSRLFVRLLCLADCKTTFLVTYPMCSTYPCEKSQNSPYEKESIRFH